MDQLEESIRMLNEAAPLSDQHSDRATRPWSFAVAYHQRYREARRLDDLEHAIQYYEDSLDHTPRDLPKTTLAQRLEDAGSAYGDRFRVSDDSEDGEKAIRLFQEALDKTQPGTASWVTRLHKLGSGYAKKYQKTKEIGDIDMAILLQTESSDATPTRNFRKAGRLYDLGCDYLDRYRATRAMDDLNLSIQLLQDSIDKTLSGDPKLADRLSNLASGYSDRYRRTGSVEDMDSSIRLTHQAIDNVPPDTSHQAQHAQILYNLASSYFDRYQRAGAIEDLDTALRYHQESVDKTPPDSPSRQFRLQNLGTAFRQRFMRTGHLRDLETAIQVHQESIDISDTDTPERIFGLFNLGADYLERYKKLGVAKDLDAAVRCFEEAVDKTPQGHASSGHRLQSLGIAHLMRYLKSKLPEDLDRAIQRYGECVDNTPPDHPSRAQYLSNQAEGNHVRYSRTGAVEDVEKAIRQAQEALGHTASPVQDRLNAGQLLLELLGAVGDWDQAYEAARTTISLAPLLAPRSLEHSDKQFLLADLAGLASDAAAAALNASKDPYIAVQLLESGRGIISDSLNNLRVDVDKLVKHHPELGNRFIALRQTLDAAALPNGSTERHGRAEELIHTSQDTSFLDQEQSYGQTRADWRYKADKELEELIGTVRKLPGFEDFLLPPSEAETRSVATRGPVVFINVSKHRCDAILIEKHQIRYLPLPLLRREDITMQVQEENLGSPGILQWLWDSVAHPVLDALGFVEPPSRAAWPHVWWIPTGALSRLPLHAAGYHRQGGAETVLDRVMSSYSSSIKAIIHGRRRRAPAPTPARALLVALEHTAGFNRLPFAKEEVTILRSLLASMAYQPLELGRQKKDILSNLPKCSVFHFAGHGCTDTTDPLKSHLLLEDGPANPLSVADLLELDLHTTRPLLAYLSACGTGKIQDDRFVDESLHLISACQLVGFQHVIGTLWEVSDETCVDVARGTYEGMREGGMADEAVCKGLHDATKRLRDRWLWDREKRLDRGRRSRDPLALKHSETVQDLRVSRFSRKALVVLEDEEDEDVSWVPYVHFGV